MRARIGVLRLADSAAIMVAEVRGLFAEEGVEAHVSIEPSWANIADKLSYGLLDAAAILPTLALAAAGGIGRAPARITVPMNLTRGGNTVVLGDVAAAAVGDAPPVLAAGARLVAWMRAQSAPPRFAVVHHFSTHNLLLRYWLAASGGDPDRDMQTVVVPPSLVVRELAAGRIAGFCAGAPWGEIAAREGAGSLLFGTSAIWPHHPEKCLALAQPWAERAPETAQAVMRALARASRICADPANADWVAATLADPGGLGLSERACLTVLPGGEAAERVVFSAEPASPVEGRWFLQQMRRWEWVGGNDHVVDTVYQPYSRASSPDDVSETQADKPVF